MTPQELAAKLKDRAEEAMRYLFHGAGKFGGGRFCIGNLQGEPGESLVIYLSSGRYLDMSDRTKHGDLLQLFIDKFGSKEAGYDNAYSFLGISKPIKILANPEDQKKKSKKWSKPEEDWSQLTETLAPSVFSYLTVDRKIDPSIIPLNEVKQKEDESYIFLTYTHGHSRDSKVCGAVNIALKRKSIIRDGKKIRKKIISQAENPLSVLWGHPSAKPDKDKDKRKGKKGKLIITAGQIDCLSLRCHGFQNCVSVPFGEGDTGWIENSFDWMMDNYDEFYLFFDNDETGERFTEAIASKIGYARCKKCYLPSEYKDINEAHVAGFDLTESITRAADFKMENLVSAGELFEETMQILQMGRREDIGIPFMGWENELSVKFRIRPQEFTIVTGYGGHGKSNMLYQQIAYLIFRHKQKVVLASLEEKSTVINGLIATHALGFIYENGNRNKDLAYRAALQTISEYLYIYNHLGTANFKQMLTTFEFAIRKYGAQHAIIDSVAKTDLNIEKNDEARFFVSAVSESVNQTGAHYWLVAHSHKGDDRDYKMIPGYQQIKGDNAFGVQCFNCVTVWRNTFRDIADIKNEQSGGKGCKFRGRKPGDDSREYTAEEIQNINNTTFYISKQRVGGQVGQFSLFYDHSNYRLHRTSNFLDHPYYADEIYERYILNPELYADDNNIKAEDCATIIMPQTQLTEKRNKYKLDNTEEIEEYNDDEDEGF